MVANPTPFKIRLGVEVVPNAIAFMTIAVANPNPSIIMEVATNPTPFILMSKVEVLANPILLKR